MKLELSLKTKKNSITRYRLGRHIITPVPTVFNLNKVEHERLHDEGPQSIIKIKRLPEIKKDTA